MLVCETALSCNLSRGSVDRLEDMSPQCPGMNSTPVSRGIDEAFEIPP